MPGIVWTGAALRDLERLASFLRPKSEAAASKAVSAIQGASGELMQFPLAGRAMPELGDGIRQYPVLFSSSGYLLRYRIVAGDVHVVQVVHMRERRRP